MAERVLITGGAGFVGSHLAASHRASGDEVHILVRPGGPRRRLNLPLSGVAVHRVHLDQTASILQCLHRARPTIIYHLAGGTGRDPTVPLRWTVTSMIEDLTNLLSILSAICEVDPAPRVFIRAGSLAEYGNGPTPSVEDQREDPLTIYTTAMVAGLNYSRMLQAGLPCPVLTARFALVYGPGQSRDYFLPWLLHRCVRGETSEVSQPQSRRDMIFITDLVDGLRRMAAAGLPGGTILNLSSGYAPTMREIAEVVLGACGADRNLVSFSEKSDPSFRVQSLHGSPARADKLLGWRARTGLSEGVGLCMAEEYERSSA